MIRFHGDIEPNRSTRLWTAHFPRPALMRQPRTTKRFRDMQTPTSKPILVAAIGALVWLSSCKRTEPTSVSETESSPVAFEVSLTCNEKDMTIVGSDDGLQATSSGTTRRFVQVEAASGAKYQADDSSVLWNRGDEWTLLVDGSEPTKCTQVVEPKAD